jgi:hypothetical protein
MENNFDMLEQKLIKVGIPYSRIGNSFSTNLIFDADLQRFAKECGLVKYETRTNNTYCHKYTTRKE